MADQYQKVAAILNMDILTFGMAVKNNPEFALEAWEELEKRRQQVTEDEEYRDRRYNASTSVFSVVKDESNER